MRLLLDFAPASTTSRPPTVWGGGATSSVRSLMSMVLNADGTHVSFDGSPSMGPTDDEVDPRDLVIAARRSSGEWLSEDEVMSMLERTDE